MPIDEVAHATLHKYTQGFGGCLKDVVLATDYKIDLMAEATDGENMRQCTTDNAAKDGSR